MKNLYYTIRRAFESELPALSAIEQAAARLFLEAGLPSIIDLGTVPLDLLEEQQRHGFVWVALESQTEEPVGFAVVRLVDGLVHLEELSVHPSHARRGLGRRLVHVIAGWAIEQRYTGMTLSTFRDIPWNAPFYASMGFRILTPEELTPGLQAISAHESEVGLCIKPRVFMRKDL